MTPKSEGMRAFGSNKDDSDPFGRPFLSVFEATIQIHLPYFWRGSWCDFNAVDCFERQFLKQFDVLPCFQERFQCLSFPYSVDGQNFVCGTNIMSYCKSSINHDASWAFSEPASLWWRKLDSLHPPGIWCYQLGNVVCAANMRARHFFFTG